MKKEIKEEARKQIGKYLEGIRLEKGISTYKITKEHGLKYEEIRAIEEGSANYTIDNFLIYLSALDCYFYLADKDGKHLDFEDMARKAREGR